MVLCSLYNCMTKICDGQTPFTVMDNLSAVLDGDTDEGESGKPCSLQETNRMMYITESWL